MKGTLVSSPRRKCSEWDRIAVGPPFFVNDFLNRLPAVCEANSAESLWDILATVLRLPRASLG